MIKILKNTTIADIEIFSLGRTVPASDQMIVELSDYIRLSSVDTIAELSPAIMSGDIVINNGIFDLEPIVGISHISEISGVELSHTDITLLPGVGDFAASFVEIDEIAAGHQLDENEKIYGQTRIDNLAGGNVLVQLHCIIDNSNSDRWIQFELRFRTTTGDLDKTLNTADDTLVIGPVEVPTTPFLTFEINAIIPSVYFENDEHYLIFQIKRVAAVGKTAPSNSPIIWRYCKAYFKVVS